MATAGRPSALVVSRVIGVPELVVLAIIAAVIWIGWIRGRL